MEKASYNFKLFPSKMATYSKTQLLGVLSFGPLLYTFLGEKRN